MKKCYYILLGLLVISIGAGAQVYAASLEDLVIGKYNMKYKNRLWIQREGTLTDTTYGTCKIKADYTFVAIENDGGTTRKYKGKWRIKNDKFTIKATKSFRNQIKNKAIVPWIKEYVKDQGEKITNISIAFSRYKITKAEITVDGPDRLKIILNGIVRGHVSGGVGNVKREFKYKADVIFLDRI
jgi:hypothetical protein